MSLGSIAHDVAEAAGKQPFILLFAVVAAGYGLGKIQVKKVALGTTAATLLTALGTSVIAALSGVRFRIPEFASTVFFNLFIFSVGMKVGPQFVSGLRRDAARFIIIAVTIPALSFGLMFVVRALFHFEPGVAAGIFAGGNTATPGLGAAQSAYAGGRGGGAALENLSTAFVFSYCLSMVLFIMLIKLVPLLTRRDVKRAARELEAAIRGPGDAPLPGAADEFLGGPLPVAVRSFRVEERPVVGQRLGDLRHRHPLISIERILRGERLLDARDEVVIEPGDTLALHGRIPLLMAAGPRIGPEVDAPALRETAAETVDVVVTRKGAAGNLLELATGAGHGLYLNAMFRGGEQIPFGPETVVQKGDVLRVTGARWRIQIIEKELGKVVRASLTTDLVTLAVGLALGALIGLITVRVGSIKLTVGSAVGLMLVGLTLSALRTRNPALGGPFPEPARQLLEDLGLNVFYAILGLNAGVGVIRAVGAGELGPVLVSCLIIGFIPAIVIAVFGRRVLKMNDALLMGAVAGGRCSSAGMRAAMDTTASSVPAISYPVTFAISNVIITLLSYVMALLS